MRSQDFSSWNKSEPVQIQFFVGFDDDSVFDDESVFGASPSFLRSVGRSVGASPPVALVSEPSGAPGWRFLSVGRLLSASEAPPRPPVPRAFVNAIRRPLTC